MKQIHIGTDGKHYVERDSEYKFDFCASTIIDFLALTVFIIIAFFFIQLF